MCALARSMCAAKEMSSTTWTWVAVGRSVLSTIVQDLFLAITCLLFYLSEAIYTTSLFYGEGKSILFTVDGFNEASVWDQRGRWFVVYWRFVSRFMVQISCREAKHFE